VTGEEVGQGETPDIQAPAGRGKVSPGSRPYLELAEIGYLGQVALAAVSLILLAATQGLDFTNSIPLVVVGALIELLVSVAWLQLGRKEGNSWFLAAGISGAASTVLGLALTFGLGVAPSGNYIIVAETGTLVYLVYFVMQVSAFFSAAHTFQVRLFRYAGYIFVASFVVTFVVGMVGVVLVVSGASQMQNVVALARNGLVYLFSVGTSMAAGIGFHRLRRTAGVSGLNLPTGGQPGS
jgi:hypothetical protein